jgi:aryl-alcohol dehydrogenase-like predicted oxidoreductase
MTLRPEPYQDLWNDRVFDALDAFEAEAVDRGVDSATLALAWLLSNPYVGSIVVGPRRPEHLAPVFSALDLHLSPEERSELAGLFA